MQAEWKNLPSARLSHMWYRLKVLNVLPIYVMK